MTSLKRRKYLFCLVATDAKPHRLTAALSNSNSQMQGALPFWRNLQNALDLISASYTTNVLTRKAFA